jgi:hypothetical protein
MNWVTPHLTYEFDCSSLLFPIASLHKSLLSC